MLTFSLMSSAPIPPPTNLHHSFLPSKKRVYNPCHQDIADAIISVVDSLNDTNEGGQQERWDQLQWQQ
jgi:hypothetical protein